MNIYCFWTGDNELSLNRLNSLEQIKKVSECNLILVTTKNLHEYILPEHPLHESYHYLSFTHKADYLRTYFMNFHGGGYTDIKETTGSWKSSFDQLHNNENIWMVGYKEIMGGVANPLYTDYWDELIGNGCYICKPQTPLTKEWYNEMISLLDTKLDKLKQYPALFPQDCAEISNGKYPIEWNEMLGRIFHKYNYLYRKNTLNTLPMCNLNNYR